MQDQWWKHAVIYGVDVERFCDSDKDGVGDFAGLCAKLPYLSSLGFNCVWLLPFYPSTDRDNGYDITDYYRVAAKCGRLSEFQEFVHRAGEQGIRVVLDLVAQHTSSGHPWFQAARQGRHSAYRDYYVWSDQPPKPAPGQGTMFPGQEDSVWTFDDTARAYYYHRFYHFQPTLNHRNPRVLDELKRVVDFWLSFGIAGFRVDAASHLVEDPLDPAGKGDAAHTVLRELYAHITRQKPDAMVLGEVDEDEGKLASFFDGEQLNMMFNFFLNNYLMLALATESAQPIREALSRLPPAPENGQWANFLRNLDEADLERLDQQQRDRVLDLFAPQDKMRIYGRGIRRRLAPMLGGAARLKMAYSLLFALPGAPVVCYGDEIGMGEDLGADGRNSVRAPMQWTAGRNGGFSAAPKARLVQPMIDQGPFGLAQVNVAAQDGKPGSLLEHLRRLTVLRHQHLQVGQRDCHILECGPDTVLALGWRTPEQDILALHNLSGKPARAEVPLNGLGTDEAPQALLGQGTDGPRDGRLSVALEAHDFRWLCWMR
ncbi:alpha-amylase family protein [Paracoccus thiocyanatus]|uniref:Alpha-amylase n=1 Tax=Paracoccus thiocyanatus TaxID=34006 RepID=A0A3D8PES1_9RHOB|nr:alpha-amylase family protein [Paracoccus thiocyanatus]RDW14142.1 alpha-amylase [Paracoccus thiocyanatus]